MKIDHSLKPTDLKASLSKFWEISGSKIGMIESEYDASQGSPVFTVGGKYTTRGWTEWTQGFQYGAALLQFEATGEEQFLQIGRHGTVDKMAPHLTHMGVHDHGFNNVSTYGNLLRLMEEGFLEKDLWQAEFYKLALKASGAVQAARWTTTKNGGGFIYSFNGPHSLFVDTIRSVRILFLSHFLGHSLKGENDVTINLFERGIQHICSTLDYNIYLGKGRDKYDVPGRTAHECIFNTNDGNFRAPNAQQGFSGFTTWTRGLAWAICGLAEELEFLKKVEDHHFEGIIPKETLLDKMIEGAKATCDFYIQNSALDGIPYWDTGAPLLYKLGDYTAKNADPFNPYEPVDSTAAAIAAQGFFRLGNVLSDEKYTQAALTITQTLLSEPYLSESPDHQGLLLHSIYHEPNGWDYVPVGQNIASGESSMWGDYHVRELAIQMGREIDEKPTYAYFNCLPNFRHL